MSLFAKSVLALALLASAVTALDTEFDAAMQRELKKKGGKQGGGGHLRHFNAATGKFKFGNIEIDNNDPDFWKGWSKRKNESKEDSKSRCKRQKENRKEGRKKRKAARKVEKKRRKNRKREKEPQTGLEIVGGKCVEDHICAEVRGDPHFTTFDGLKYDCQGHGEFVLAKSMQSAFEIQARFQKPPEGLTKAVTVTRAISVDSGVEGAPQIDMYAEDVGGTCIMNYYVDGELVDDFGVDGLKYPGLEFFQDVDAGKESMDYAYFTESGVMVSVMVNGPGKFGCVMNSKICLPPAMVKEETIYGLLGTPTGKTSDDWVSEFGTRTIPLAEDLKGPESYNYCVQNHCVRDADDSIFGYEPNTEWSDFTGCGDAYDSTAKDMIEDPTDDCIDCCETLTDEDANNACLLECMEGGEQACVAEIIAEEVLAEAQSKCPDSSQPRSGGGNPAPPKSAPAPAPEPRCASDAECPQPRCREGFPCFTFTCDDGECVAKEPPAPDGPSPEDRTTEKAFTKGDPHFKTFGGELYDYHGECDLVLLHNPDFKEGLGMDIHIRTKIQDFWSSVESAAIRLGDDTMEIRADPSSDEWLWFNGKEATSALVDGEWYKHEMAGFLVRYKQTGENTREANLYLKGAKEVLVMKTFKSFVRIDVNWQESDNYFNSVGLLGAHAHEGKRLGRDGELVEDFNAFGQEWQVVPEVDGSLFHSYEGAVVGKQCVMPPAYHANGMNSSLAEQRRRLGESTLDTELAEKACNHLVDPEEVKACVFDVVATQDLSMASTW